MSYSIHKLKGKNRTVENMSKKIHHRINTSVLVIKAAKYRSVLNYVKYG